jgi:hypothetical protein
VSHQGYLLLRRAGALFGVASAAVRTLERQGAVYRVTIGQEAIGQVGIGGNTGAEGLLADEVLGVVEDLEVRPLSALVRRYWAEAAGGWAVHAGAPVVVVDLGRPPRALVERTAGEVARGE